MPGRQSPLLAYIDRISIIHLPSRVDRYASLQKEFARLGASLDDAKIDIPSAPMPPDAGGFPSKAVYGNFLSHLQILRNARSAGVETVLVLEDDAIFSRRFARGQAEIVEKLKTSEWGLCFFGHSLEFSRETPRGLVDVPPHRDFIWAHCYAVHARALPGLIAYFEMTLLNEAGHPDGGRLYIDGALNHFRRRHPEHRVFAANPVLSVQKRCPSSIAGGKWWDRTPALRPFVAGARAALDEAWRLFG